jgi:hypothetical protein
MTVGVVLLISPGRFLARALTYDQRPYPMPFPSSTSAHWLPHGSDTPMLMWHEALRLGPGYQAHLGVLSGDVG